MWRSERFDVKQRWRWTVVFQFHRLIWCAPNSERDLKWKTCYSSDGLPLLALAQVCFPKGNRDFLHVLDKASRQSGAEKHGANHRKSGNNLPRPDVHLPLGDADRTPVLWNAQTFQTLLFLSCLCSLFVSVTSWLPCVKQRCYMWGKRVLPLPPARSNPPVTTYEKRLHYELNADILVSSALVTFVSTLLEKRILHSLPGCQLQRL